MKKTKKKWEEGCDFLIHQISQGMQSMLKTTQGKNLLEMSHTLKNHIFRKSELWKVQKIRILENQNYGKCRKSKFQFFHGIQKIRVSTI